MRKVSIVLAVLLCATLSHGQSKKEKPVSRTTVTVPADPPQKGGVNPTSFGHQVVLSWTAPTTCADGSPCTPASYNIYKANVACPSGSGTITATKIASTQVPTTTYTDTNIVAPGSYCYYVTAVNAQGESTSSNLAGGTLQQPLLASPANLAATLQ